MRLLSNSFRCAFKERKDGRNFLSLGIQMSQKRGSRYIVIIQLLLIKCIKFEFWSAVFFYFCVCLYLKLIWNIAKITKIRQHCPSLLSRKLRSFDLPLCLYIIMLTHICFILFLNPFHFCCQLNSSKPSWILHFAYPLSTYFHVFCVQSWLKPLEFLSNLCQYSLLSHFFFPVSCQWTSCFQDILLRFSWLFSLLLWLLLILSQVIIIGLKFSSFQLSIEMQFPNQTFSYIYDCKGKKTIMQGSKGSWGEAVNTCSWT